MLLFTVEFIPRMAFTACTCSGKPVFSFKYWCALKEERWKPEGRCPLSCLADVVPKEAERLVSRQCVHHQISLLADRRET